MKIINVPHVRDYYVGRMRDFLSGDIAIPRTILTERGDEFHNSDLQLCPVPAVHHRTFKDKPQLADSSVLRFFRGRAEELVLASELPPRSVEGIVGRPDDMLDGVLAEIKTTNESCDLFDPEKSHLDWISRMMGYCFMYEVLDHHLFVYFTSGNLLSYMYWMKRDMVNKFGPDWSKEIKYKSIAADAWRYTFTEEELQANWDELQRRKRLIQTHLAGEPMSPDIVNELRPAWQCKGCVWNSLCDYRVRK